MTAVTRQPAAGDRGDLRVRADDPAYQRDARLEADFWARSAFTVATLEARFTARVNRFLNRSYTGDPGMTWLGHVIARGPYVRAAMLGSTGGTYLQRMEDEAPELVDRVLPAEEDAARVAGMQGCAAYALFRRR